MQWLWTVLGMLSAAGVSSGNFYNASACFGRQGCDRMGLACPDSRRIFLFQTLYGGKIPRSQCSQSSECGHCCQIELTDCFSNFTSYTFGLVYLNHGCWNSPSCNSFVAPGVPCSGYTYVYSAVYYSCLSNGEITDFHQSTTISAPAVAVRFEKTGATQYSVGNQEAKTWHCQVDTADCVQRQADVILVKESYAGSSGACSSVGWSGGPFLPCVPDLQYLSFSPSTPFSVSVNVKESGSNPVGWAAVRTQDGSNLNVTCGYTDSSSIPPCSGKMAASTTTTKTTTTTTSTTTTTTTTTPATTMMPTTTPVQTSLTQGSSHSTNTSSSSTSPAPVSETTSSSTTKSSASQDLTSPSTAGSSRQSESSTPAAGSTNIGFLVGGVAAAVVALVAVVLGVFCCVRRRKQKPREDGASPTNRKSSMQVPLTSVASGSPPPSPAPDSGIPNDLDEDDGDYDSIGHGPKPQKAIAASSGTPGKPRSPAEEPDYDRLGQKKSRSSSSNPATTYGRLGEVGGGGEDTDYSYDHLARGRQAAPDVIDSDYDSTSALHLTSEGDYDVAGIPRKQQVITGNDYATAGSVTSEGDYNRLDFKGRKKHVVNGSDYETAEIVS